MKPGTEQRPALTKPISASPAGWNKVEGDFGGILPLLYSPAADEILREGASPTRDR